MAAVVLRKVFESLKYGLKCNASLYVSEISADCFDEMNVVFVKCEDDAPPSLVRAITYRQSNHVGSQALNGSGHELIGYDVAVGKVFSEFLPVDTLDYSFGNAKTSRLISMLPLFMSDLAHCLRRRLYPAVGLIRMA